MTETAWKKAYDLYQQPNVDWGSGEPKYPYDGKTCYCVGGAIAQAMTGDARNMYDAPPDLQAAYRKFSDHVGVAEGWMSDHKQYIRVYTWNDRLEESNGKRAAERVLLELHEAEVAQNS